MGCTIRKSSVDPAPQLQADMQRLGFSERDLEIVRLVHKQVAEKNAGVFSLRALSAFTGTTLSPLVLRLFRVTAATDPVDLRLFLTRLWWATVSLPPSLTVPPGVCAR